MKVIDGTGSGSELKVNSRNQSSTFSVVEPEDKLNNREGNCWSITQSTTPVGTNDYIFYFKNTSTVTYSFTDIRAVAGAATVLSIDAVSGTPTFTAGVDLTPVNRNRGKSNAITATIKEDTNTTGLTDDGQLFFLQIESANKMNHLRTSANIIVPPGLAIAMESSVATAVTALFSVTVLEDL